MNCLPHDLMTAGRKDISNFLSENGLYMPSSMLSIGNDAKTAKGQKYNYLTGIVYLIPDYSICPASKLAKCDVACLVSAGRGVFNSVIKGRQNKTAIFKRFPSIFYELVRRDIIKLERKAKREGLNFCVRLNGTSDINHNEFIKSLPLVQFYDYTKMSERMPLPNYHLTFSYSGANPKYLKHVEKAIDNGLNVAVVFKGRHSTKGSFLNLPIIDGDDSDLRFLDYKVSEAQSIVALYAKGKAKKDTSGFVVDNINSLIFKGASI